MRVRVWCRSVQGAGCLFSTDAATTQIYTLSLHDALPISVRLSRRLRLPAALEEAPPERDRDRALVELLLGQLVVEVGAIDEQRSEERRVGKECRSGWSPHQLRISSQLPGPIYTKREHALPLTKPLITT